MVPIKMSLSKLAVASPVVIFIVVSCAFSTQVMAAEKSGNVDLWQFGIQASAAEDTDFSIGGRVQYNLEKFKKGLHVVWSFDYFFPEGDVTYFEINGSVIYGIQLKEESLEPYFGGGLLISHTSAEDTDVGPFLPPFVLAPPRVEASETDVGVNLLGGLKFKGDGVIPFLEFRIELGGLDQFVVTGGILF